MSSTNGHDMNTNEGQSGAPEKHEAGSHEAGIHEALCALVLGELEGEERAALERELDSSPELRAERDEITATIGLVRAACGEPEGLSDGAMARLEGLAAAPLRPWYARGSVRMAAGFGLVAISLVVLNEGRRVREGAPEVMDELARSESPMESLDSVESSWPELNPDLEALSERIQRENKSSTSHPEEQVSLASTFETEANGPLQREQPLVLRVDAGRELEDAAKAGVALEALGYTSAPSAGLEPSRSQELGLLNKLVPGDAFKEEASRKEAKPALQDQFGAELRSSRGFYNESGGTPAGGVVDAPTGARARDFGGFAGGAKRAKAGEPAAQTGSDTFFLGTGKASQTLGDPRAGGSNAPAGPSSSGPPRTDAGVDRRASTADGNAWKFGRQAGGGGAAVPPALDDGAVTRGRRIELGEEAQLERRKQVLGAEFLTDEDGDDFDARRALELGKFNKVDAATRARLRADSILRTCRAYPNEKPSMMYFRFWGDNGFELAQLDPQSTFGVDVDTASYTLARRYLRDGYIPEKAAIRTEEFVNYFDPDLSAPTESTFAIHADLAPSRYGSESGGGIQVSKATERWMMRVVVRGKEVSLEERDPLALTFVVDVSGSMKKENRLGLVKHALRLLVAELDSRDSIALVAFSNEARLVLPMTSVAQRGVIEAGIYSLNADGGTNAEGGLLLGYEVALASLSNAAQSRVVLLSDGVANIGQTDQDRVSAEVRRHREAGIYLNTIGVGMENHNDVFLEQLADNGDGLCNYVDGELEARRALVENFTGAFQPIARDVKVQVEFDPTQVFRYRQLGYENRAIADADFRNDAVDAGEVGAGHQVVALYEIELLKPAEEAPLATVRLRWKQPSGAGRDPLEDSATEIEVPVSFAAASSWEGSSDGYKRSVLVAQFAEILRRSTHARNDSLDELIADAAQLERRLSDEDFTEFLAMVQRSRDLVLRSRPAYEPLAHCVDTIRRNNCLRAEYEALQLDREHVALRDLERQNVELEHRIRELIREQVGQRVR